MSCKVQISLDLHTIEDALHVAEIAVQCGVDWLEAGTGLMVEQGLHVVMGPVILQKSRQRQVLPTLT